VIVAAPAATPVTVPFALFTAPVPMADELHTPPVVASAKLTLAPTHTLAAPVMVAGTGFTVTTAVLAQPVGNVYEITDAPALTPLTIPVVVPTVATEGLTELHVPPVAVVLSAVVVSAADAAAHTFIVPVIAAGNGLAVIVLVAVALPQLSEIE